MVRYGLTIQTAEKQILGFLHSIETREGDKWEPRRKVAHHHLVRG